MRLYSSCDSGRVAPLLVLLMDRKFLYHGWMDYLAAYIGCVTHGQMDNLEVYVGYVTHRQMEYLFTESGKMQGKVSATNIRTVLLLI